MNFSGFYRAFEERFYAPRSVIKSLRMQYLPYVSELAKIYPGAPTFDVGCGRGEWLELMQTEGFNPFGVDLDEGMLSACQEQRLSVAKGDAITYLQKLNDESQAIISAFHVVEHIAFEQLQTLVFEALRVLKPGGLLIMETPNPENIEVATRNFYLDPTHERPVTPMLLGFLPEFHGFARVTTVRLQEKSDIHTREDIKLTDVLTAVSPDYAVIAQKSASVEILNLFSEVFSERRGVDLHNLANRYDRRLDDFMLAHHETRKSVERLQTEIENTNYKLQTETENSKHKLREEINNIDNKLRGDINVIRGEIKILNENLVAAQQECRDLRKSISWRITAPFRETAGFLKSPGSYTMVKVLQYPELSDKINRIIMRFPGLHEKLRRAAVQRGLKPDMHWSEKKPDAPVSIADISPRAQAIHASLVQEIAKLKS